MKFCNCTLPYSNPDVCKTCNNGWGIFDFGFTIKPIQHKTYTLKTFNPETHELVEKKEAKINRLEKELESLNVAVEGFNEVVLETSNEKSKAIKKINEITEELKQLK